MTYGGQFPAYIAQSMLIDGIDIMNYGKVL